MNIIKIGMNVLFILPCGREPVHFHQGIESLSSFLKSHDNMIRTDLLRLESLDVDKTASCIKTFKPDLICITSTSLEINLARSIGKHIQKAYHLPVVLGGIHATIKPEECLQNGGFDIICRGEGEETLLELTKCIRENKSIYDIKNLCFKKEGNIVCNPLRPRIENLDTLPYPDCELLQKESIGKISFAEFAGSRGCPFSCAYCAEEYIRNLYDKKSIRFKTPEYLISEIKEFNKKCPNLSFICFHDDNFNFNKKWLIRFCDLYAKQIGIPFTCNLHFNLIDEENIAALKKANCQRANVALETGNEEFRKTVLNKNIDNDTLIKGVNLLKKYRIKVWIFNMLGLPGEKEEHMLETIKFNRTLKPDYLFISYFYPLPGSKFYDLHLNSVKQPADSSTGSLFVDSSKLDGKNGLSKIAYYRNLFPFMVFYPMIAPIMRIRFINIYLGRVFDSPAYTRNFILIFFRNWLIKLLFCVFPESIAYRVKNSIKGFLRRKSILSTIKD